MSTIQEKVLSFDMCQQYCWQPWHFHESQIKTKPKPITQLEVAWTKSRGKLFAFGCLSSICWQVLAPYFSTDFEISGTLLSSSAGTHKINMGNIKEYHLKVPAPLFSNVSWRFRSDLKRVCQHFFQNAGTTAVRPIPYNRLPQTRMALACHP